MTASAEYPFLKLHGCGNDFIVASEQGENPIDWEAITPQLSDRHRGIGSDGVLIVRPSETVDFDILMLNPDGSRMGMCGNGIRCVTHYVNLLGMIEPGRSELVFEVEGRVLSCAFEQGGALVTVNMGSPIFSAEKIPVATELALTDLPVQIEHREFPCTILSMGNPHCVHFVQSLDEIDLLTLGPKFEHHSLFPQRVNVEFVERVSDEYLKVLVWERGAGATLACGTGACAVLVAACLKGLSGPRARIALPGGEVDIQWDRENDRVFLTGPSQEVFSGSFNPSSFIAR